VVSSGMAGARPGHNTRRAGAGPVIMVAPVSIEKAVIMVGTTSGNRRARMTAPGAMDETYDMGVDAEVRESGDVRPVKPKSSIVLAELLALLVEAMPIALTRTRFRSITGTATSRNLLVRIRLSTDAEISTIERFVASAAVALWSTTKTVGTMVSRRCLRRTSSGVRVVEPVTRRMDWVVRACCVWWMGGGWSDGGARPQARVSKLRMGRRSLVADVVMGITGSLSSIPLVFVGTSMSGSWFS